MWCAFRRAQICFARGSCLGRMFYKGWIAAFFCVGLLGCQKLSDRPAGAQKQAPKAASAAATPIVAHGTPIETEVPVEADGGTFAVPVTINDAITLRFTIDSGAADVSIPADVASTLVRAGTISQNDFIGTQTYVLADGSTVPSATFLIRSLKVGTVVLHNVQGSLAGPKGSLLLGQSFLSRLASWSINNSRHSLQIKVEADGTNIQVVKAAAGAGTLAQAGPDVGELLTVADLRRLGAEFDTAFQQTGMSGVTGEIAECYGAVKGVGTTEDRKRAAYCVTYDILAARIDSSFRQLMEEKLSKPVPALPFYADDAFGPRLKKFLPMTTADGAMPATDIFNEYATVAQRRMAELSDARSAASTSQ